MEMICIHTGPWKNAPGVIGESFDYGPRYQELVHVRQCPVYDDHFEVLEYLVDLDWAPISFRKKWFVRPADISELEAILQSEPAAV